MDSKQLWESTLGELELSLSRANFTTWFKNTFISQKEEERIIIGVPNSFTKTWLEKKYHSIILKALQKITENKIKRIEYRVETTAPEIRGLLSDDVILPSEPAVTKAQSNLKTDVALNLNGLNTKYTFSNFVIGKGNELAHAAANAVANKPGEVYNPLFIYGGVGLGKTHLLQAIGNKTVCQNPNKKILYVSCEKFTNDFIQAISTNKHNQFKNLYRNIDVLLIDDIQFLAGKEGTQEAFFHTFNDLHQANRQIVLTSDRPPKAIPALEQRLVSRFEWGMIADIAVPDFETRLAILDFKCQEKNCNLDKETLTYLATSIQNNVRELEGALNKIIATHQLTNTRPTLESAKKILISITSKQQKKSITPKQIINTVAAFYDININDLLGACRKKSLALPRQIIMYLMREEIKTSYPSIGQEVGDRDHTTAMHAYLKITKVYNEDEKIKQDITLIRERLYN
ncbi:chromosomal replication initiator protein DnaA [Candidatus Parcubacteria bacterium]|nr:MAG: chromosomal replication initiator protein DnaA [Candidatus Parcubacteria bacterium]